MTSMATSIIAEDIMAALRVRFPFGPQKQWVLMEQVRGGAGWDRRTADAIALGMWQSSGHELIGFEIKVSRSDWRREVLEPEKADSILSYCDRWYVVAPKGVVPLDFGSGLAVPDGMGLLEYDGKRLTESKKAPKLAPKPLTRGFIAQLFKGAFSQLPGPTQIAEAEKRGRDERDAHWQEALDRERRERDDIQRRYEQRSRELFEAFGLTEFDISEARRRGLLVREALEADRITGRVAEARRMAWEVLASTQEFARTDEADRLLADRFRNQEGPLWEALRKVAGLADDPEPRGAALPPYEFMGGR